MMQTNKPGTKNSKSSTRYILESLVPYTSANLRLAFNPGSFLAELNRLDRAKIPKQTLRVSYYRAIKRGLIAVDEYGIPRLTNKGVNKIRNYKPRKLSNGAKVLVIFDIPETQRHKRDRLRLVLREFYFEQIQRSVWQSEYDVVEYVQEEIESEGLADYVQIFEASKVKS